MILLLIACSRDVVIGIENLPQESQFELSWNGQKAEYRSDNTWFFADVSTPITMNLEFSYGNTNCHLDDSTVEVPRGFSAVQHKTDWSCIGLMEYESVLLEEFNLAVGVSEVTSGLWQKIQGGEKEDKCGIDCPKSSISWMNAIGFANQMSIHEGLTQCYHSKKDGSIILLEECDGWRLPTDKEWDQISDSSLGSIYAGSETSTTVGWVRENSEGKRHPVCELEKNRFGLCDLTGNVWEWCWDASEKNPTLRRLRGGGFSSRDEVARLDNKIDFPQTFGAEHIGFRLLRTLSSKKKVEKNPKIQ